MNYNRCPNCDSYETRLVYTTDANYSGDEIERVMLCDDCESQYTARFTLDECTVDGNPTTANAERTSE